MAALRNLFACLVHESPECAVDLVRNLRCLDPDSGVLLYDGSQGGGLLQAFPFARYGAMVHPSPRPLEWGRLHDFALDAMRFALAQYPFDTLTIVDSDQLLARPGYSEQLAAALAGRSGVGLLGNSPGRQPGDTRVGPAAAAYREIDLWRPWLRRFAHGEEAFVHWTFWPATVFTAAAARDLVTLFDHDAELAGILRRSRIWATEEVVLPTLVALLGHEVVAHPASYDYVQFRQAYSAAQIEEALARPDVSWLHPVPRRYDDPLRKEVRVRFDHYRLPPGAAAAVHGSERSAPGLPSTLSILARIRTIPGWLDDDEADLLIAAAAHALASAPGPDGRPNPQTVVEIGSYCGRSTVLLGSVVQTVCPEGRVVAIDPHRGQVGALDQGLELKAPTLDILRGHLAAAGLQAVVEVVPKCSFEVDWKGPIRFLLIDGLHDYVNVARDFLCFEAAVVPGGYVAFHDYAEYYPGVRAFVDDLLAGGRYEKVQLAKSLMVVRKLADLGEVLNEAPRVSAPAPLFVSCIMPTADRRAFVPRAIRQFLAQDYPAAAAELLVIDDGDDRVADLIPPDPRIRYLALDGKRTIGAKRNLACAEARGEIILHWDDDDWMAEQRIRVQVEALSGADAEVSGLPRLYFHQPDTGESWEYACPRQDRTWLAGATLCYKKELWRENPFPDTSVGEDTQFLWTDRPKRLAPLDDPSLYVATLHPGNTSSRRTAVPGWHPAPGDVVRRLLGEAAPAIEVVPPPPPVVSALPVARIATTATAAGTVRTLGTASPVAGRVSCIMPTRADRRRFLPQAVRCFLRQDYPDRELVIVDDGGDSAAGLLPADPRIVYLHLPGDHSAGHKRNLAVERSQGEIVVHWDDDDGSAEDRLSHQVQLLLERRAEVCGFADETVLDLNDREGGAFWRCTPALHARMFFADVHGRSIAYRRELWGPHRYPDRSLGEDAAFLAAILQAGARLVRVSGAERFLYVRHAGNAWSFRCGEFLDRAGWERVAAPGFLAASDREFYRLAPPA